MRGGRGALRSVLWAVVLLAAVVFGDYCIGFLTPQKERFEKILEVFEAHPTRLWALKRNLSAIFQDRELHTDGEGRRVCPPVPREPAGALTVCAMGDSLTFGWGVGDGEAYPSLLQQGLGARVINLAVPGYTSWQGLKVLHEQALPLKPRLVTVSYGVNDVSKFRFFASDLKTDARQSARSRGAVAVQNFLMATSFYCFFRNLNFALRERSLDSQERIMRLSGEVTQRVLPGEYAANLEAIAATLRERGIAVLFVKMPLNLPRGPKVAAAQRAEAKRLIAAARLARSAGRGEEALEGYLGSLGADPLDRAACWEVYDFCRERGDRKSMEKVLELLKKQEVYASSNLHVAYNTLMDEAARKAGVPVVDVERAFDAVKGKQLFVDPVRDPYHPSAEGHRIIARHVLDAAKALLLRNPPATGN